MNNSCRKIICVTGKMASGKNTVCSILEQNGFISLDADKVVHSVIQKATPKILDTFNELATSKGIILTNKDGSLNRKALAELIFEDKNLLKQQEEIIYPFVTEETQNFININNNKNNILNATVLYKIPQLMEQCDYIFFVKSSFLLSEFKYASRSILLIINDSIFPREHMFSKSVKIPCFCCWAFDAMSKRFSILSTSSSLR